MHLLQSGVPFNMIVLWLGHASTMTTHLYVEAGAMHGPTPASLPGGQIITTKGLVALVQERQAPFVLFDVLGQQDMLPNAVPAASRHGISQDCPRNNSSRGSRPSPHLCSNRASRRSRETNRWRSSSR